MTVLEGNRIYQNKTDFDITVLFTPDNYQIIISSLDSREYRYGALTTEFLNYNSESFIEAVSKLNELEDAAAFNAQVRVVKKILQSMPIYDYLFSDKTEPAHHRTAALFNIKLDWRLEYYRQLAEDLGLVQKQYTWLLENMNKKGAGKREYSCAGQLFENGIGNYISESSLRASSEWEPPDVQVQYMIGDADDNDEWQLYEKMVFHRLIDFLYVELFKGMMIGNYPKRCKNCGRWFLKEKQTAFEYCNDIAPGETDKTCRDVGARNSFSDKVKNNEVWLIHQRAYKKYYGRVLKGKMTKEEFYVWATEAEVLRDRVLAEYEHAVKEKTNYDLGEYKCKLNAL